MSGPSGSSLPTPLADRLARCIRCGLCLPACPTYDVFRTEMDGPRGRLMLMRAAWEDPAAARGAAGEHLDLCLGCLSCETACPSGVEYGSLLGATRERIAEGGRQYGPRRMARRGLLALLARRPLLHGLSWLVSLKQELGLVALGRRLPLPALAARMLALLPQGRPAAPRGSPPGADGRRVREAPTRFRPGAAVAEAAGERRGRVALFRGCVQDAFLGRVNAATVRLLQRHGLDVDLAGGQTCCGAAAHHLGESDLARRLARRNLAAFASTADDPIVSNAGGCGAMLARYPELFATGSDERRRARRFAERVRDVSEVLVEQPAAAGVRPLPCRAAYVDSCHLRHAQGVVDPPRRLLRAIPGLELVELARPDHCCGSAGVYNLTQGDTADRLLESKLGEILAVEADVVVTTNPGCQLQLAAGVRRAGLAAEVVHLVELLDRSQTAP